MVDGINFVLEFCFQRGLIIGGKKNGWEQIESENNHKNYKRAYNGNGVFNI